MGSKRIKLTLAASVTETLRSDAELYKGAPTAMSSSLAVLPEPYSVFELSASEYAVLERISKHPQRCSVLPIDAVVVLIQRHLARGRRNGRVLAITLAGEAVLRSIQVLKGTIVETKKQSTPAKVLPFRQKHIKS